MRCCHRPSRPGCHRDARPWRLLAQAVDLLLDPVVAFRPPGDGEALEAGQFDIEGRAFGVEDIVLGECLAFAHYREARFVVQSFQAPGPTLVASTVVRSKSAVPVDADPVMAAFAQLGEIVLARDAGIRNYRRLQPVTAIFGLEAAEGCFKGLRLEQVAGQDLAAAWKAGAVEHRGEGHQEAVVALLFRAPEAPQPVIVAAGITLSWDSRRWIDNRQPSGRAAPSRSRADRPRRGCGATTVPLENSGAGTKVRMMQWEMVSIMVARTLRSVLS